MQLLSKTVSWIFLPLFMPIYGLLLTLYIPSQEASISNTSLFDLPDGLKTQILFLFVVFTSIAPGISFILMYRRGLLSSVEMDQRKAYSHYSLCFPIVFYCSFYFGKKHLTMYYLFTSIPYHLQEQLSRLYSSY